ncbi:pectate lyase superfamily protein-domain-containing protein [Aspergillus granulosus]|uniref:Pectate lyase superfamily protein-domain-containing protein n=1 Tax=Aspergillus granulosus TaxID=176169 RepID=A0ABR4I4F3_9EURO
MLLPLWLLQLILLVPLGSGQHLPVFSDFPPAPYMVDQEGNTFGTAPDQGTRNGPVLPKSNSTLGANHGLNRLASTAKTQSSYWLANMEHGQMPYAPSGYKVWRNVMDYGATGDGVTDDTAAINAAVTDGNRCGASCGSTTTLGAIVYFPPGTYAISSPILQYYYTQFIGDPTDRPTIAGLASFSGIALIDTDLYIPGGNGSEWYVNQNQFYRQIRNFIFDLTAMPASNQEGDQTYVPTGIHWQVAQSTSLQNLHFNMPLSTAAGATTAVGIFTENGSGGFMSDLSFYGGNLGMRVGSQQFTATNLQFTSCLTAVSMIWDWGWTWKNVNVLSCYVAFDCTQMGGIDGQGVGSLTVLDSTFNGVPYAITVNNNNRPAITLDNLLVENSASVVLISGGATLLAGPTSGSETISSWAMGRRYTSLYDVGSNELSNLQPVPSKPAGLLSDGSQWFQRSRPQYEDLSSSSFISVADYGAVGDGTGDQSAAINEALANANGAVVFFPAGIYAIQSGVFVPVGTRIVGEAWSQIMATGSYFQDADNPAVAVTVGHAGDQGVVEISDILLTVSGPTAGAILLQWNVHESTQGSAGMWDTHFRVGGAVGSNLQAADCPASGSVDPNCMAASLLLHVPSYASGYFENVWAWVADHDLDIPEQSQINIFCGRGILVESSGPTWLYGTSSEHSVLYQYQVTNASNIFLGHLQTESPYYQATPPATNPFSLGQFVDDPLFENCLGPADACAKAWAVRILKSTEVYIYGAGVYSWFDAYRQDCLTTESCQKALIDTSYSQGIWMYSVYTKGSTESISPQGGLPVVMQADNRNGYLTAISAWLALAEGGGDLGGDAAGNSRHVTPDNVSIVPLPCTTVAPSATFTMSAECTSGILALPTAGTQNSPPGPSECEEECDIFRLLSQTCCGSDGTLANPILIPPLLPLPLPIPLPIGFIPNVPFSIPINPELAGDDSDGDDGTQTIPCCVPLAAPLVIPAGFIPLPDADVPPLLIPPPITLPNTDGPSTARAADCTSGVCCDPSLSMSIGLCGNGNFPLYLPGAGIDCSTPDDAADLAPFLTDCQSWAMENPDEVAVYADVVQQCLDCPGVEGLSKRDVAIPPHHNNHSTPALVERADACPSPPATSTTTAPPSNPTCDRTYTCDGARFPNVCGHAESAISVRGFPAVMTRQRSGIHGTQPWYKGKYGSDAIKERVAGSRPAEGWGLAGCTVEEYPWSSGRVRTMKPALRLVPEEENRNHGRDLNLWFNGWSNEVGGFRETIGRPFCVEFINSKLNEGNDYGLSTDAGTLNSCAAPYGPEFLLVTSGTGYVTRDTPNDWDPWFNVEGSGRLSAHTIISNTRTKIVVDRPPMWCKNPSPGMLTSVDGGRRKVASAVSNGAIPPEEQEGKSISCRGVPENLQKRAYGRRNKSRSGDPFDSSDSSNLFFKDEDEPDLRRVSSGGPNLPVAKLDLDHNVTAPLISHAGDTAVAGALAKRQSIPSVFGGSYLDVNIYNYLPMCQSDDDYDPCYLTQCNYYDANGDLVGDADGSSSTTTAPPTSTTTSSAPTPTVTCTDSCLSPGDCSCNCSNGGVYVDTCADWCCITPAGATYEYNWLCGSDLSQSCPL